MNLQKILRAMETVAIENEDEDGLMLVNAIKVTLNEINERHSEQIRRINKGLVILNEQLLFKNGTIHNLETDNKKLRKALRCST